MEVICALTSARAFAGGVVALGTFDGVHRGHQAVVARTVAEARRRQAKAIVLTFRNHPLTVLAPERAPRLIEDLAQRRRHLRDVDALIELPFTAELATLTPADFLALLRDTLRPCCVVTGENYTFGERGCGTAATLRQLGADFGFAAIVCPSVSVNGVVVSSTAIRAAIRVGDVAAANALLGHPFALTGKVRHGDERGRSLGFPTANLDLPTTLATPADGVYAVRVHVNGESRNAVANVGDNPTFGLNCRRLEAHLLDFEGNLYGATLRVEFCGRLRDERVFASRDALTAQLRSDLAAARNFFAACR